MKQTDEILINQQNEQKGRTNGIAAALRDTP